jgi:uncharacterized protein (DUF58 family)
VIRRAGAAGASIALGLAFALAAAAFAIPSLYVPGVALALLGGVSIAWVELAARPARLVRAPGPRTVVEDEPYPLSVRLEGALLPPPGGELHEPLLEEPLPLGPRARGRLELDVRFPRRGRRPLESARLLVHDPLRLHARAVHSERGGELLVLPRVEPVLAAHEDGGAGGQKSGIAGRRHVAPKVSPDASVAELEMDGLRPYREGSPASRIHWPTVARTGELIERRLVGGGGSARLVVLDARQPADESSLDSAVRAAASLCVHLAGDGGCTLLVPSEPRPLQIDSRLEGWPRAHARLALVESSAGSPPLSRIQSAGALFWVTARPARRPPAAMARVAAGAAYLVSPAPLPGVPAAFTVAGCTGQRLGAARSRGGRRRGIAA